MRGFNLNQLGIVLLAMGLICTVHAEEKPKAPNMHTITWDAFARNTLALHKKLIDGVDVVKQTKVGGYAGMPEFYIEETFYHPQTKKLVSRVQWEKENPERLHTIEVYLYDDKGRVIRDYAAAYLPNYYKAPTQTLITLHQYNGDLHAFRSFDASGYRVVERCTGQHQGKAVDILLDEDEIYDSLEGKTRATKTDIYKACFAGVQEKAGQFLTPQ